MGGVEEGIGQGAGRGGEDAKAIVSVCGGERAGGVSDAGEPFGVVVRMRGGLAVCVGD